MKEFFGIDVTLDKNSEILNCQEFLSRQPSAAHTAALDSAAAALDKLSNKAKLPKVFRIVYTVVSFLAFCLVLGIIRSLGRVSITQTMENAAPLVYLTGILLLIWAIMSLWKHRRNQKVTSTEEFLGAARRVETAAAACLTAMGVPENAPKVDVMSCRYTVKKGKIKYLSVGTAAR